MPPDRETELIMEHPCTSMFLENVSRRAEGLWGIRNGGRDVIQSASGLLFQALCPVRVLSGLLDASNIYSLHQHNQAMKTHGTLWTLVCQCSVIIMGNWERETLGSGRAWLWDFWEGLLMRGDLCRWLPLLLPSQLSPNPSGWTKQQISTLALEDRQG